MKLATFLRIVLLTLLGRFLWAPEQFSAVFQPLTRHGSPAIYTQSSLLFLTISHLVIVAVATVGAIILAVGLAVLTTRPSGREFLPLSRAIANIGQTFPPVAVLALAVPIFGFGPVPTLIALFLYGLLPIFETALTGLNGIPPQISDAGQGMGMTDRQRFLSIDLPLAFPVILSGIRLSVVISLATATIGSTVAANTLGEVIVAGLLTGNTAYVLQGGLIVAALAILINDGFLYLEHLARANAGDPQALKARA